MVNQLCTGFAKADHKISRVCTVTNTQTYTPRDRTIKTYIDIYTETDTVDTQVSKHRWMHTPTLPAVIVGGHTESIKSDEHEMKVVSPQIGSEKSRSPLSNRPPPGHPK